MQFLTTTLSLLSLYSVALGCTRYNIQFTAPRPSCIKDQATFNAQCNNITDKIGQFSADNQNIYGSDFTTDFTGCDSCGAPDATCYCTVTAWRYHEWQTASWTLDIKPWDLAQNWTAIDKKTVHC